MSAAVLAQFASPSRSPCEHAGQLLPELGKGARLVEAGSRTRNLHVVNLSMDPVDESLIEAQEEGASTFCRRKRIARAGENTMSDVPR